MADPGSLECLMRRYQAGDGGAFEQLHATLRPELQRYLAGLTGDVDRAGDLVQETFLRMHQARRSYDPGHPFRPWAFAIARHVFLMDRRASARRARRESLVSGEGRTELDQPLVAQLLGRVSAECRRLLELRYIAGFDFREIASAMNLTSGAARVRAVRALSQLREMVK